MRVRQSSFSMPFGDRYNSISICKLYGITCMSGWGTEVGMFVGITDTSHSEVLKPSSEFEFEENDALPCNLNCLRDVCQSKWFVEKV